MADNNKSILVTAVITTHKRIPQIVTRAIKSILNQTYSNIEIIIVDDSPQDYVYRNEVKKEIEELAPDAIYIQNSQTLGACAARNVGLKHASGKYIAYLDDDDEWLPNKIESQLEQFAKANINTCMVYCAFIKYDESTGEKKKIPLKKCQGMIYEELLRYGNICGGMSMPLIRTDYLREIGGFDEKMPALQDYDVWLRLAKKYPIIYDEEYLVKYYWGEGDQISKNPDNKIGGIKRIISKNENVINNDKHIKWKFYSLLTNFLIWKKQVKEATRYFKICIKTQPFKIYNNLKLLFKLLKCKIEEKIRNCNAI